MNTVLETAMRWQRRGISPIPLRPRSKIPAVSWKRLQFKPTTRDQVKHWFGKGCQNRNLGLLTGPASGGLIVVDFDYPLPYHQWAATNPKNAETYTVATKRGYHVYFRLENLPARSLSMKGGHGEVKASGYILTPPSVHPSGVPYKALNSPVIAQRASLSETGVIVCSDEEKPRSGAPRGVIRPTTMPGAGLVTRIKAAYLIIDYLEQFSPLHHSGGDFFMCCCPLHDDRHPSMWVNSKNGTCRCFKPSCVGAERVLDVIGLHARLQGISNSEAIYGLGSLLG